eukprot:Pgem_evm1s11792
MRIKVLSKKYRELSDYIIKKQIVTAGYRLGFALHYSILQAGKKLGKKFENELNEQEETIRKDTIRTITESNDNDNKGGSVIIVKGGNVIMNVVAVVVVVLACVCGIFSFGIITKLFKEKSDDNYNSGNKMFSNNRSDYYLGYVTGSRGDVQPQRDRQQGGSGGGNNGNN